MTEQDASKRLIGWAKYVVLDAIGDQYRVSLFLWIDRPRHPSKYISNRDLHSVAELDEQFHHIDGIVRIGRNSRKDYFTF